MTLRPTRRCWRTMWYGAVLASTGCCALGDREVDPPFPRVHPVPTRPVFSPRLLAAVWPPAPTFARPSLPPAELPEATDARPLPEPTRAPDPVPEAFPTEAPTPSPHRDAELEATERGWKSRPWR